MKLTDRRVILFCLGLSVVLIECCLNFACYSEPQFEEQVPCVSDRGPSIVTSREECSRFLASVEAGASAIESSLQMSVMLDFQVELHPQSDGGSWEPDVYQRDAGYTAIYGETFCKQHRILVASTDWGWLRARNVLCHEMGHAALRCGPFDHYTMGHRSFDARCNETEQQIQ